MMMMIRGKIVPATWHNTMMLQLRGNTAKPILAVGRKIFSLAAYTTGMGTPGAH